jgi:membrane protease YdiL (CAAX protease family)
MARRLEVFLFVAFSYLTSWGVYISFLAMTRGWSRIHISRSIFSLAQWFPGLVALCLAAAMGGREELQSFGRRLLQFRVGTLNIVVILILAFAAPAVALLLCHSLSGCSYPALGNPSRLIPMILVLMVVNLGEELGWRGYLLDRLRSVYGFLGANILLAVVWGVWHVPVYLALNPEGARTPELIALFLVGTPPVTLIFSLVYFTSRQSLFACLLLHASLDAGLGWFFARLPVGELRPMMIWVGSTWVLGLAYWALLNRSARARKALYPPAVPHSESST